MVVSFKTHVILKALSFTDYPFAFTSIVIEYRTIYKKNNKMYKISIFVWEHVLFRNVRILKNVTGETQKHDTNHSLQYTFIWKNSKHVCKKI